MTTINLTIGMKLFFILWGLATLVAVVSLTTLVVLAIQNELGWRKYQKENRKLIRMVNRRRA